MKRVILGHTINEGKDIAVDAEKVQAIYWNVKTSPYDGNKYGTIHAVMDNGKTVHIFERKVQTQKDVEKMLIIYERLIEYWTSDTNDIFSNWYAGE